MTTVGIITPIKDEVDNLPRLIRSVENQSLRPEYWTIVDDGSTDGSSDVIADAAERHSWIHRLSGVESEAYDIGVHYARVLARGFGALLEEAGDELDYYVVLDGDMELSEGYLESVTSYLDIHDEVAIACGSVYTRTNGTLEFEARARKHPFGGATVYDGEFYRAIGGPPQTPCVDSVTKAKAHMRGYEPRYATELDVRAIQSRPAHENGDPAENYRTLGANNYAIGYPPLPAAAKGCRFMLKSTLTKGVAYLQGYFSEWLKGSPRVAEDDVVSYYYRQKHRDVAKALQRTAQGVFDG